MISQVDFIPLMTQIELFLKRERAICARALHNKTAPEWFRSGKWVERKAENTRKAG
jgi:hypothetical protein